jgi:hypothetical protein
MPFVTQGNPRTVFSLDDSHTQPDMPPPPAPSFFDTLGAAFRQDNTVGSWLTSKGSSDPFGYGVLTAPVQPNYSPWDEVKGTPYADHWSEFAGSTSHEQTEALKAQFDQQAATEQMDRVTLSRAGWEGTVATMAASILDPMLLVPIGGEAGVGARTAYKIARSAAVVGAATTAQEGVLQATQETRPLEESAINIGTGIALGGLLGGAHAYLTRPERDVAANGLTGVITSDRGSIGAAATPAASLEDLTPSGTVTSALADATKFVSPNARSNFREAPLARQVAQELAENTMYQRMNDAGQTLGASAETQARVASLGKIADAQIAHDDIFKEMKQSGINMSRGDFEDAVGDAMRNGDQGENDFVSRAATAWRDRLFDPLKNEAIDQGLLPADVNVATAPSYFSRAWSRDVLEAREAEFKSIVTDHYAGQMADDYAGSATSLRTRLATLDQEKADLQLGLDDRTSTLADLQKQGDALDEANGEHVDRIIRINDARRQARAAADAGDATTASASRTKAARIKAEGGSGLQSYLAQRRTLRSRARAVDLGYAGMAERGDNITSQLAEAREANARSLNRLLARGRVFEREAQRLDPDKLQARISDLRDGFADVLARSEKAQDRLARAAERLGPDAPAGLADRLKREAAAEAALHERLNSISARLEAAESLDPDMQITELREAMDGASREVSDTVTARGERIQRLRDRLATLDPAKIDGRLKAIDDLKAKLQRDFYDRWEIRHLGEGVDHTSQARPDFRAAARDIADEVHNKLTGRNYGDSGSVLPEFMTPITRGPMKDRTFNIPDAKVKDFLDPNVVSVAHRYGRTMAAEIELTRRFGRADMRDQLDGIRRQYADMREQAGADPKRLKKLAADERGAIEDITAMRDLIRGTYKAAENGADYARVLRGVQAFNYIRSMGKVTISNLSDLYRGAFAHGIGRFVSEGVPALVSNMKGIKLSVKEAQLAGQVTDRVLQSRLSSLVELGDPYRSGTMVEKWLQNGTRVASTLNGISIFTDVSKSIASVMSQNRILEGVAGTADRRYLAYLGIDGDMAGRIAQQFAEHGHTEDTVRIANTQGWTDPEAVRAYRAAVSKDVDSIVVTRSVGDVPLFANTPIGKALLQFKTFNIASNQRVLLRGMQEGRANFVSMTIGMSTVGVLSAFLRARTSGDQRYAEFLKSAQNPGYLLGEALDASGMFSLPIEAGSDIETLTGVNPIKSPLMHAFPGSPQGGQGVRRIGVDPVGRLLGPTAGLISDVSKASGAPIGAATGDKITDSQAAAAKRLVPFQSYIGMRQALDLIHHDG